MEDPLVAAYAALRGDRLPPGATPILHTLFDDRKSPRSVNQQRKVHLGIAMHKMDVDISVEYEVNGVVEHANIQYVYTLRKLQFISRAIHKMMLESLAYEMYVHGHATPIGLDYAGFDIVRQWVRYGQSGRHVRPVLCGPGEHGNLSPTKAPTWAYYVDTKSPDNADIFVGLDLFGVWYGVSLTSPPSSALEDLLTWAAWRRAPQGKQGHWYISDGLYPWR
jgi:hypothetical protein